MSKTAGWISILIILAVCAEIVSFAVLTFVPQVQRFIYRPPEISRVDYEAYIAERDPVIGWPNESWLALLYDERGARTSPANAALGDVSPCISVYGDSFAFSDEVEDEDAWANVLAENLGCRVDGYGVSGHGADQGLLRLEGHLATGQDLGDTLILTLFPDNLNRHVNQWRHLLTQQPLSFKPAYRATANGVELSPIFEGDYARFRAMTEDPAAFLPAEAYIPNTGGFRRMKRAGFPYSLSAGAIFFDQIRSFRGFGTSGMTNFYNYPAYYDDASGPSAEKKAVTSHIVRRFAALCAEHGKTCAFVITPDPELVLQRTETGDHDLRPWLEEAASDLIFLDGTDIFEDLDDICRHLTQPDACKGHYNQAGYARLADFIEAKLAGN